MPTGRGNGRTKSAPAILFPSARRGAIGQCQVDSWAPWVGR